jgi:protoheme IX farnesyltransferase
MLLISESAEFVRPVGSAAALSQHEPSIAGVGDYVALMKPRVMSLVVFTALVGMMIAPGQIHPVIAVAALICISVGAGAAGALNMWYDADIDAVMTRTAGRPIPRGRIAPGEALGFGVTLAGFSVAVLRLLVSCSRQRCWPSPSFTSSIPMARVRRRRTSSSAAPRARFRQ